MKFTYRFGSASMIESVDYGDKTQSCLISFDLPPPPTKKMTCKNCFFLDLAVNELKWLGLRYHDFDKLEFGEVFQKYREKDEQTLNGLLRSPHIRV